MYGDEERTKTITYTGIFIALFAVGGYITIPMIPVPFTLQTLFVILSGAVMRKKAVIPVLLYIILGTLGLPVFHQFTAGPGVLLGPTGGYMVGFIFAALIVGYLYGCPNRFVRAGCFFAASFVILFAGALWLFISTPMGLTESFLLGMVPFIPGDCVKSAVAFLIAERINDRI